MRIIIFLILFIFIHASCRYSDRRQKIVEPAPSNIAGPTEALQYINEKIEKDPDNAELYHKKANLAMKMKDWETAEKAVRRYTHINGSADDILLLEAEINYKRGKVYEAIETAEQLFKKGYRALELNELLFNLYFENREFLKSLDQVNLALEKKPGDAQYHYLRARNYLYIKDTSSALEDMQAAFNKGFRSLSALAEYIDMLNQAGREDLAFKTAEEASTRYPENVDIQLSYAKLLIDQHELTPAEKILQRIIERGESQAEIYTKLGEIKQATYHYDSALYYIDRAIAESPDYLPAYYLRAKVFQGKGQYYRSLNIYREILDSIPQDAIALKESEKLRNYLSYLQDRQEEEDEEGDESENRQALPELEQKSIQN